jgi:hypothetical protein
VLVVDNLLLLNQPPLGCPQVLARLGSWFLCIVINFDHSAGDFGNIFVQGCWR